MSQDVVSDGLNMIMNAKKAGKNHVEIKKYSKFLIEVLKIGKKHGYIESYEIQEKILKVSVGKLKICRAVKPRYTVTIKEIEKYVRRYLPSRNFGILILSTSSGILTHEEAYEQNVGGSIIAYFY